jgi:hypothetical protein
MVDLFVLNNNLSLKMQNKKAKFGVEPFWSSTYQTFASFVTLVQTLKYFFLSYHGVAKQDSISTHQG